MGHNATFARLLAVWNGDAIIDEIDSLVTSSYRGHLGSRERDAVRLKEDITAYRRSVPDVRFSVEHQFASGDYLATRLTASAGGQTVAGLKKHESLGRRTPRRGMGRMGAVRQVNVAR
jgi:hypothetical protein